MIAQTAGFSPGHAVSVVLMPNRSLSHSGFRAIVVTQGFAVLAIAGIAAWQGNVFALPIAILQTVLVTLCLRYVWRCSGCGEMITLDRRQVQVAPLGSAGATARFDTYWARLRLERASRECRRQRLLIGSHGRTVEIGAFLSDDERHALKQELAVLLDRANDPTAR